jgi:hypothetical protein
MSEAWPPAFDEFAPFDFTAEGDTWAWFEPVDGMEFENDHERRATLTAELFIALTGHLPHDPTTCSMKEYSTRESAVDALVRAISAGAMGVEYVEPVTVETT